MSILGFNTAAVNTSRTDVIYTFNTALSGYQARVYDGGIMFFQVCPCLADSLCAAFAGSWGFAMGQDCTVCLATRLEVAQAGVMSCVADMTGL